MNRIVAILLLLVLSFSTVSGQKAVPCVNKYVTNTHVTQYQYDAMYLFTFNVGCKAFSGSTLLKDVNRGDMVSASSQFMRWVYVKGAKSTGLVNRRALERRMFEGK